jgi:acetyltransferase-like isoleucine patch superfamily enzyme
MADRTDGKEIAKLLDEISGIIQSGLDAGKAASILYLIGCPVPEESLLAEMKLFSEYLPMAYEYPYTDEQRYLHFLWESVERSPLCFATNFAFPFRRMIAKKLFRKCGKNFCCENGVRFNFGQFIEVGDNVFMNAGTFIDSKGGVTIGNSVGIGEYVRILTHTHSESNHAERTYGRVIIGDYAKIYSGAMIFYGIKVGEEAIVAAGAVVTKDVPANHVVAGIPAEVIRERHNEGRHREELNHRWLFRGAFQDE